MITLNNYIEALLELQKQGYGELPLIYSEDDEGNNFHYVINLPSEYKVEDLNQYYLESDFEYDENDEIIDFTPNCIIIN